MKVKILGGVGEVGAFVVQDLLRNPAVDKVIIADINKDAATKQIDRLFRDKPVAYEILDADSDESLREVMESGYIIANCIGPHYKYCRRIAEAAMVAGCDYCDICDDYDAAESVLGLDKSARDKKITMIVCLGTSPGVTNMLAKRGFEMIDQADEIHTFWAVGGSDPTGPSELYHLAHICSDKIPQFINGKFEQVPALSGSMAVEFPEPVGRIELSYIGHSEPVTLPRFIPGVKTVTNRGGLYPAALNDLVLTIRALGLFETMPLKVGGVEISPRDYTVAHFRYLLENYPDLLGLGESESISVFRVEVIGKKDGLRKEVIYTGTNEVVATTGRSLSIGIQMLGENIVEDSGVFAPEGCLPTTEFFERLIDGGGVTLSEEIRIRTAIIS